MSACKAKTKAGKACKAAALKGSDRCAVHSQPGTKGTAKKARRDWRPAFLDSQRGSTNNWYGEYACTDAGDAEFYSEIVELGKTSRTLIARFTVEESF